VNDTKGKSKREGGRKNLGGETRRGTEKVRATKDCHELRGKGQGIVKKRNDDVKECCDREKRDEKGRQIKRMVKKASLFLVNGQGSIPPRHFQQSFTCPN
jgi:hypothetical protein